MAKFRRRKVAIGPFGPKLKSEIQNPKQIPNHKVKIQNDGPPIGPLHQSRIKAHNNPKQTGFGPRLARLCPILTPLPISGCLTPENSKPCSSNAQ